MSHEAMTWGYEQIVRYNLKTGPQATLLRLCNHANAKGLCWPSVGHIAAHTNQSDKTVVRHLALFCELGIVARKPRGGDGAGRQTNVYELVGLKDILTLRAKGHFDEAKGHQVSFSTPNIQNSNRTTKECAFALFWQVYPVKRNKAKAKSIWQRKKLDSIADHLVADVQNRIANDSQWLKGYIPHATTYLNGERWEDELITENTDAETRKRPATFDEIRAEQERAIREAEGWEGGKGVVASY